MNLRESVQGLGNECPKGLEGEKGKGEMIGLYLIKKIKTLYKITFKLCTQKINRM